MRVYANNGVVSGESGAACLGGLLALAGNTEVGLDESSVIMLIVTESATDPVNYERVVGHPPA